MRSEPVVTWESTTKLFLVRYDQQVFFALPEDDVRRLALALFDALEAKRNES